MWFEAFVRFSVSESVSQSLSVFDLSNPDCDSDTDSDNLQPETWNLFSEQIWKIQDSNERQREAPDLAFAVSNM